MEKQTGTAAEFRSHFNMLLAAEAALESALRTLPEPLAEKRPDIEAALEDTQAHRKFVEGILENVSVSAAAIADGETPGGELFRLALRAALADEINSGGLMHYELPKEA